MGLKELLDADTAVPILIGLFYYVDKCAYNIFKDSFSSLKDVFDNAEFYYNYLREFSSEKGLRKDERNSLERFKQSAIERYESVVNENLPLYFLFSRPLFYFQTKKELSGLKEESNKKLRELKTA